MTENELELLEGLRALAAAEPRTASPSVEQRLIANFRGRKVRRRRAIWGSASGAFAAAAAVVALSLWVSTSKQPGTIARSTPSVVSSTGKAIASPQPPQSEVPEARFAVVRTDDLASSFYPLPEATDLPAIETAMVVRVEMPASSLQFMGVPLGDEISADPVEADVLLGQDGLARGVRLVQ